MDKPFLIVGAGLSGATLARVLAEAGHHVQVIDERDHVAGNCHTYTDSKTGILVHAYGPHIFHTDQERVWEFVSRFADFVPYRHRVLAVSCGQVFRLPINLHTLSQFFRRQFSPDEARDFLRANSHSIDDPRTFEEQALSTIGEELYEAFFKGYTIKQWGRDPTELPASILKRLPVRFSYDDNYFHHQRQAMPEKGYTSMVENMLSHENISLGLGRRYEDMSGLEVRHIFYSGPIDRFFNYTAGRLAYRTLEFEEHFYTKDFQGTPVMNFCDADVPHTRITEHHHLSPWHTDFEGSITYVEKSKEAGPGDMEFYPVRLINDQKLLSDYLEMAKETRNVTFFGRLGNYSYIDMDVAISQALTLADRVLSNPQEFNHRQRLSA